MKYIKNKYINKNLCATEKSVASQHFHIVWIPALSNFGWRVDSFHTALAHCEGVVWQWRKMLAPQWPACPSLEDLIRGTPLLSIFKVEASPRCSKRSIPVVSGPHDTHQTNGFVALLSAVRKGLNCPNINDAWSSVWRRSNLLSIFSTDAFQERKPKRIIQANYPVLPIALTRTEGFVY